MNLIIFVSFVQNFPSVMTKNQRLDRIAEVKDFLDVQREPRTLNQPSRVKRASASTIFNFYGVSTPIFHSQTKCCFNFLKFCRQRDQEEAAVRGDH